MAQTVDLRDQIWESLLEALDRCQATIDLVEKMDAGSDQLIAEWEELDAAYGHMHNVKRWIGRAWRSQEAKPRVAPQRLDTMIFTDQDVQKIPRAYPNDLRQGPQAEPGR